MEPSDKFVISLSCVGIKTHDECVKINLKVINMHNLIILLELFKSKLRPLKLLSAHSSRILQKLKN
jgi:hypothetical protein